MERTCILDFPALHESNFAAYFTGCHILGPEKLVKIVFETAKSILTIFFSLLDLIRTRLMVFSV